MHKLSSHLRKGLSGILAAAMIGSLMSTAAFADTSLGAGTYDVDAALSCYVNAMGGVEFSDGYGLLTGSEVTIDGSGNAAITLDLGFTSGLSIYGMPCTAYIGDDERPGYYDSNGNIQNAEYTTAVKDGTTYVNSITFPVEQDTDQYTMWLYLNSNVMGCQLGDGSGSGSSNTPGALTAHTATLTIDWDSAGTGSSGSGSSGSGSSDSTDYDIYGADMVLSMYVDAMGGIEFSDGHNLLKGNSIKKDEDGNYTATLKLGMTEDLAIYGMNCEAYISPEVEPGYYDESGTRQSADYTTASLGGVEYVKTMTFPVSEEVSMYYLWLYLDSNIMGCQFGDGSGNGSSNNPGVATPYAAILTIDWDTLEEGSNNSDGSDSDNSFEASAMIEYVVQSTYEVEIPSIITVDSVTKTGSYEVKAASVPNGGYMLVKADESGTLTSESGNATMNFTNTLSQPDEDISGNKLYQEGDYLEGTVTVTGKASETGTYTGTLNFEIVCR